jgi:Sulfotransferase family
MTTTGTPIPLNGRVYEAHEIPVILFGQQKRLAYVHNTKAACTLAVNFLFFSNHGYMYIDPEQIHASRFAFVRLGPDFSADNVNAFNVLAPETFSIVRDPLQRFISGFISKIFSNYDSNYFDLRDLVTSAHGVDLSAEADPAQSCLAFAKLIDAQKNRKQIERHFRPQYLNLGMDGRFQINTVMRLEDHADVLAFLSKWTSPEKAQWLLSQQFGTTTGYSKDKFMSDELISLVHKIYARDYELFYS